MKTVIFDFDGTLADTFELVVGVANTLLRENGRKPVKDPASLRDKTTRELLKEFKIPILKLPMVLAHGRALMQKRKRRAKLFPGIQEMLETLRGSCKVGVITSNSKELVEHVLHGIPMDFIAGNAPMFGKHLLLRKHALGKNIVYVGDEVRDIEACRKIGIPIVAVTWGYNTRERLRKAKPTYLVDTPEELLEVLI